MAVVPIWKDIYLDLDDYVPGSPASASFELYDAAANLIYSGKAYRRPSGELTVRVNDILADYLSQALPDLSLPNGNDEVVPFVASFYYDDGNGPAETWEVAADWSYDTGHDPDTDSYIAEVDGVLVPGMPLVFSAYGEVQIDTYDADGTLVYSGYLGTLGKGSNFVVNPGTAVSIVTDAGTWAVRSDVCADYALYYVNAFGGWDFLAVQRRVDTRYDYDRKRYRRDYDNSVPENRGTVEYQNGVTKRWTVRTGWLSDEQSARMQHLLGSTQVYLYDIAAGTAIPVVINNTEAPVKTYRGEGAQLVAYELEVELAREQVRR